MNRLTLDKLLEIAEEAGNYILKNMTKSISFESKSSHSDLVTDIDREVEMIIKEELARYGIEVVGEESWNECVVPSGLFAMVDPIDGTLNFVHGLGYYAVSIALIENGETVMGVVHSPVLGETFYASQKDEKAYMNGKPIAVSNVYSLKDSLFVTGWPYEKKLLDLTMKTIDIIMDVAAGALIAKKAGAIVSGISKKDYIKTSQILATTPGIYESTKEILKDVLEKLPSSDVSFSNLSS